MNFKSLLLGAAAVASATGVQAADLPVAPEPVDYVRICDAYGARFYYIPGTETCLRVGGRVRADYRFHDFAGKGPNNWDAKTDESTRFRARAYVRLDARTQTEYGLLKTYLDLWFTSGSNAFNSTATEIWDAYVQLGGFTFGRTGSFFDHWTGENWGSQIGQGLDNRSTVLAYTAAFGNGLSASASLESNTGTRLPGLLTNAGASYAYGGHRIPAFVANLMVSQGWGSAQLSGMVRQTRSSTAVVDSVVGWAIAGDVALNLPMLGAGDTLGIRAAYASAASGYVDTRLTNDAVINAAGTSLDASTAWGIAAGITHNWTPTVSTSLTGTYSNQDTLLATADLKQWSVHGQVAWAPISGFVTGVEVEYLSQDFGGATADNDNLTATFRIQRTF
ncbi:porin [Roseibium aggregatum]|uniref:Porin n=1 Tax=Roseibium aggregatum TaxID=187304 RepID=A0A926NV65_9HYPH|nr:porin [Roseibium aggregatum]MBD1544996.1 porin [Roseibium aggregatum]